MKSRAFRISFWNSGLLGTSPSISSETQEPGSIRSPGAYADLFTTHQKK